MAYGGCPGLAAHVYFHRVEAWVCKGRFVPHGVFLRIDSAFGAVTGTLAVCEAWARLLRARSEPGVLSAHGAHPGITVFFFFQFLGCPTLCGSAGKYDLIVASCKRPTQRIAGV